MHTLRRVSDRRRLAWATSGLILALVAVSIHGCRVASSALPAATSNATATPILPDCAQALTKIATPAPLLPTFAPDCACEIENVSVTEKTCLVRAAPDQVYPCARSEAVHERVLAETAAGRLIVRDHTRTAGCWHGTTSEQRSLRYCTLSDCATRTIAERIWGDPLPSPDTLRWAFVAAGADPAELAVQLFVVDLADGGVVRLDTQTFPQVQVVGAQILSWWADGLWLEISLWDGRAAGYHRFRLRTDGHGDFEPLP